MNKRLKHSLQKKVRHVTTNDGITDKEIVYLSFTMIFLVVLILVVLKYADKIDGWDGMRVQGYPCELAEISPDIPIEVKQKCRKLRSQK
jgi:hypothetical protein